MHKPVGKTSFEPKWAVWLLAFGLVATASCTTVPSGSEGRSTAPRHHRPQARDPLRLAQVDWPPALRRQYAKRLEIAQWMVKQLLLGSMATGLVKANLPASLSLNVLYRGNVYFGKMDKSATHFIPYFIVSGKRRSVFTVVKPQAFTADLTARAQAVHTMKAELERRSQGWRKRLATKMFIWLNHFVFRRPDKKLEGYLIGFPMKRRLVVLGAEYQFVLSPDGKRVIRSKALHSKLAVSAFSGDAAGILDDKHEASDGNLPTVGDLLRLITSPYLRGLNVIGPRYSVLLRLRRRGRTPRARLFNSSAYLRLRRR